MASSTDLAVSFGLRFLLTPQTSFVGAKGSVDTSPNRM